MVKEAFTSPNYSCYFRPRQDLISLVPQPTSASSSLFMSSAAERLVISGITSSRIFISRRVNAKSNDFLMPIITTNISGNRMEVLLNDFITHKQMRHASWISVNMWTRLMGTCARNEQKTFRTYL